MSNKVKIEDWRENPKWLINHSKTRIEAVLEDPIKNIMFLSTAFSWSDTPQGTSYWSSRAFRTKDLELDENALSYLKALLKSPTNPKPLCYNTDFSGYDKK